MQINTKLVHRLTELSTAKGYNAYERFAWPLDVPTNKLWCSEDLLTTYGTDLHARLSEPDMFVLSKWEAINFASLNVHGIKDALAFLCLRAYEKRYVDVSEYLHFFIAEENAHLWFFAKFCTSYGGKIYPSSWPRIEPNTAPIEEEFYMFSSILIFEEFVNFYNQKVGTNPLVDDIVREINHQHYIDESRHVSFGREIIKSLFDELVSTARDEAETRLRVAKMIRKKFLYFITLMYNPLAYADAHIHTALGFDSAVQVRNHLRHSPSRRSEHQRWFQRTANFFVKCGVLPDTEFLVTERIDA